MSKMNFLFSIDTETGAFEIVNQETGEIKSTELPKAVKKSTIKKMTEMDTSGDPLLILEENKYTLNGAAVKLMDVKADDRLNIKFRKINGVMTPVIGTNSAFKVSSGNRLTKSFTVACRGANNEALAAYGTTFVLEASEDDPGTFVMHGNRVPEIVDDENIDADNELPEELKVDLATMKQDIPDEATELTGDAFEEMLNGIN